MYGLVELEAELNSFEFIGNPDEEGKSSCNWLTRFENGLLIGYEWIFFLIEIFFRKWRTIDVGWFNRIFMSRI